MINKKSSVSYNAAITGIMTALLSVGKLALSFIPNIEITSFMIIIFTVFFGKKVLVSTFAFVLIEGIIYGFGVWWIGYLYIWPALCLITLAIRRNASKFSLTVLSACNGFLFGFFMSFVYMFIGSAKPGLNYALTWWIAGIPFDLMHGAGNILVMLCLYTPVTKVLKTITDK